MSSPDPSKLLTLTPPAFKKVKELLAKAGKPEGALRVRIVAGGCAGRQYRVEFAEAPRKDDTLIEDDGARVLIDSRSLLFLVGSEIDYAEGLLESGFKINNPNAKGECSCGDSFHT